MHDLDRITEVLATKALDPRLFERCAVSFLNDNGTGGGGGNNKCKKKPSKCKSSGGGGAGGGGAAGAGASRPKPNPAIAAREAQRQAARNNPMPIPQAMLTPHYGSSVTPPVSAAPNMPSQAASDYRAPIEDVNHSYQQLQNSILVNANVLLGQVKVSASAPSEGVASFANAETENCNNGVNSRGRPCRVEGSDGCKKVQLGETCYHVGLNTVRVEMLDGTNSVGRDSLAPGCDICTGRLENAFGLLSFMLAYPTGANEVQDCYENGSVESCG